MVATKKPWLTLMATPEFDEHLAKEYSEFKKKKKGEGKARREEFEIGLEQVWDGYLRTGRFQKQAGLKGPLRFLRALLRHLRPHYKGKKDWEKVQNRITSAIRARTRKH